MSHTNYRVAFPVPGLGKPLYYVPDEVDPFYVGEPLPTALLEENFEKSQYGSTVERTVSAW